MAVRVRLTRRGTAQSTRLVVGEKRERGDAAEGASAGQENGARAWAWEMTRRKRGFARDGRGGIGTRGMEWRGVAEMLARDAWRLGGACLTGAMPTRPPLATRRPRV